MGTPYSGKSDSWGGPPGLKPAKDTRSTVDEDWDNDIIGYTPAATAVPDTFVAGDSLEDVMAGLSVDSVAYGEDDDEDMIGVPASEVLERATADEPEDDPWANYEPPAPERKPGEIICPAHGSLCPRGICKDYKAIKRGLQRQEEEEKKRVALAEKRLKKKLNGGTTGQCFRPRCSDPYKAVLYRGAVEKQGLVRRSRAASKGRAYSGVARVGSGFIQDRKPEFPYPSRLSRLSCISCLPRPLEGECKCECAKRAGAQQARPPDEIGFCDQRRSRRRYPPCTW